MANAMFEDMLNKLTDNLNNSYEQILINSIDKAIGINQPFNLLKDRIKVRDYKNNKFVVYLDDKLLVELYHPKYSVDRNEFNYIINTKLDYKYLWDD